MELSEHMRDVGSHRGSCLGSFSIRDEYTRADAIEWVVAWYAGQVTTPSQSRLGAHGIVFFRHHFSETWQEHVEYSFNSLYRWCVRQFISNNNREAELFKQEWFRFFTTLPEPFNNLTCECGAEIEVVTSSGHLTCMNCSTLEFQCPNCREWVRDSDWSFTHSVCASCAEEYFVCDCCDQSIRDDSNSAGGQILCNACYAETMRYCYRCGEDCSEEDITYVHGEIYCPDCAEANAVIHPYATNVLRTLRKDCFPESSMRDKEIYYGVEFEVIISDAAPFNEKVKELEVAIGKDFAIFKKDSTIGPRGVEIVTLPARFEVQMERWTEFFKANVRGVVSWKGGKCGIHIHIRREVLSPLTIGKMMVFLNDPKNETYITKIAGRYGSYFCKNSDKKLSDAYDTEDCNRYEMLNVSNRNTVELRIFRGSFNRTHFLADLQFTDALVRFCRTTSFPKVTVENFTKFITEQKKRYPDYLNYMSTRMEEI